MMTAITSKDWLGGIGIDGGDGEVHVIVTGEKFIGGIETFGDNDKGGNGYGVGVKNQDSDTGPNEIFPVNCIMD